jgi:hypothetical protein
VSRCQFALIEGVSTRCLFAMKAPSIPGCCAAQDGLKFELAFLRRSPTLLIAAHGGSDSLGRCSAMGSDVEQIGQKEKKDQKRRYQRIFASYDTACGFSRELSIDCILIHHRLRICDCRLLASYSGKAHAGLDRKLQVR